MGIINRILAKYSLDTKIPRLLAEMEAHPENFKIGEHCMTHLATGREYLISNGIDYYAWRERTDVGITAFNHKFGELDQIRFHNAFQKLKAYHEAIASSRLDLPEVTA